MLVTFDSVNFDRYDVFVAGSGLASYALCKRLSEAGKRTLVFETGLAEFDDVVQSDFSRMYGRGHFEGSHWQNHWVRAFGGTSALWAGWCGALSARNFRDWPINREDLDDYYRLAANYLRRTEDFLSFSTNFLPGFSYRPISWADPVRLGEEPDLLLNLPNIDYTLGVTLSGLQPNHDRSIIESISLYELGGMTKRIELRPKQFLVLAAGAVGNAQILLSSQPDEGAAVGNENDQVGRYLMEHPHMINCARIIAPGNLQIPATPSNFGDRYDIVEPDDSVFERIGELDVSMEIFEADLDYEDPVEAFLAEKARSGVKAFGLTVRTEMPPEGSNRFKLAEGTNPAGQRRLRAICYVGTETFRAVDRCLEILSHKLAESGAARLGISNDALVNGLSGGGHIMGTTRMGVSPKNSVVNSDCRVHGYSNLFVAGSSVFTTSGYVNPTLTIMALAARLGDKLAKTI